MVRDRQSAAGMLVLHHDGEGLCHDVKYEFHEGAKSRGETKEEQDGKMFSHSLLDSNPKGVQLIPVCSVFPICLCSQKVTCLLCFLFIFHLMTFSVRSETTDKSAQEGGCQLSHKQTY